VGICCQNKQKRFNSHYGHHTKILWERRLETELITGYINDDDCCVATCCKVEEHANAKLISTAPDLLDVCLKIQEWGGSMGTEIDSLLQAAVTKALSLNN
jgi:hypothetical protein